MPMRPPYDRSLAEDELLEYDLEGNLVAGRRDPPAEILFFTTLYKAKQGVGPVIHCHPPAAVSLAATGKKILPMYQQGIKFGKGVLVSP
jgi:ribulose-5-phosphate 4-epimerase/fuculose-1-phosphate aldolase